MAAGLVALFIALPVSASSSHRLGTSTVIHQVTASFKVFGTSDSRTFVVPQDESLSRMLMFVFAGKRGTDAVSWVKLTENGVVHDFTGRLATRSEYSVRLEIWYLRVPSVGYGEATVSWAKSGSRDNITWGLSLFTGVNPDSPFGSLAQAGATHDPSPNAKTLAVASSPDELVFDAVVINGGGIGAAGPVASGGQTELWSTTKSTTTGGAAVAPGAASVNVGWRPTRTPSLDWAMIAVALKPLPDGGGGVPVNITRPTVSGPAGPNGRTFTVASNGTWSNDPTSFDYEWLDCVWDLPDQCFPTETGPSLTLPWDAPFRTSMRLEVTAHNLAGEGVGRSSTFAYIPAFTVIQPPRVRGLAKVGSTLTGIRGEWVGRYDVADGPFEVYYWLRCNSSGARCTEIAAPPSPYTLTGADAGFTIRFAFTADSRSDVGVTGQAASLPTAPVQP